MVGVFIEHFIKAMSFALVYHVIVSLYHFITKNRSLKVLLDYSYYVMYLIISLVVGILSAIFL